MPYKKIRAMCQCYTNSNLQTFDRTCTEDKQFQGTQEELSFMLEMIFLLEMIFFLFH